jgi:hypothetical protein
VIVFQHLRRPKKACDLNDHASLGFQDYAQNAKKSLWQNRGNPKEETKMKLLLLVLSLGYATWNIQPTFGSDPSTQNNPLTYKLKAIENKESTQINFTKIDQQPIIIKSSLRISDFSLRAAHFTLPITENTMLSGQVIEQKSKTRPKTRLNTPHGCKRFTSFIIKNQEKEVYKIELHNPVEWNLEVISSEPSNEDDNLKPFHTIKKIENNYSSEETHYHFINSQQEIIAKLQYRFESTQLIILTKDGATHPTFFLWRLLLNANYI